MNPNQAVSSTGHNYSRWFLYASLSAGVLLLIAVWAFIGKSSAESDLQTKIDAAVSASEVVITKKLDDKYAELAKKPFKTLKFAESLGGISIKYPRSWSVYLEEDEGGSKPVELYAHPSYVPDINGDTAFGLRMQIISQAYEEELGGWDSEISSGEVSAHTIKSNGVVGTKLKGTIDNDKTGVMVLLPLRDKTLLIWTEANSFTSDFNAAITSLVFSP